MVSLDEQIKKERDQRRTQHKPNRGGNRSNRGRGFRDNDRRKPGDRTRHIRKDANRGGLVRRDRRDRDDRVRKFSRDNNRQQQGQRRQRNTGIKRDDRVRSRIVRPPRVEPQQKGGESAQQKGRTLKVMGLHPDFTNDDLYKLFSTEGALQKCLIEQDNFGRSQTTAIVKYHGANSALSAIKNLNQHKVMNSILTVEPYKNKRR